MSRICHLRLLATGLIALSGAALLSGTALAQGVPTVPVPTVPVPGPGSGYVPTAGTGGGTSVPAPVIMVVDADRILHEAKAMKAIQGALDAQQQSYQKEITQKQNQLQTEKTDLEREQPQLAADVFEEKRHAFEKEVVDMRREVDAKKRALDQAAGDAVDKVKRQLVQIVGGIAQARHANLVLLRSAAIIADPAYDVTPEVQAQLDQSLPSVSLVVRPPDLSADASAGSPAAASPKKKKN
jgi:Skp family chaperone for outer membrane proteins